MLALFMGKEIMYGKGVRGAHGLGVRRQGLQARFSYLPEAVEEVPISAPSKFCGFG